MKNNSWPKKTQHKYVKHRYLDFNDSYWADSLKDTICKAKGLEWDGEFQPCSNQAISSATSWAIWQQSFTFIWQWLQSQLINSIQILWQYYCIFLPLHIDTMCKTLIWNPWMLVKINLKHIQSFSFLFEIFNNIYRISKKLRRFATWTLVKIHKRHILLTL